MSGRREDRDGERVDPVTDVEPLVDPREVAAGATGHHPFRGQFSGSGEDRYPVRIDPQADTGFLGHTAGVAEEPETGHVGGPGCPGGDCGSSACGIGAGHRCNRGRHRRVVDHAALLGGGDDPDAQRFGQHDRLSGPQAGVGEHAIRVDFPHDGHAVLGLGVVDGVATGDDEAALVGDVLAAEEHVA